jgi:hypothetical protein
MKIFYLNKHPSFIGVLIGLANLFDGIIRIATLGFVATSLPLIACSWWTKRQFKKQIRERAESKNDVMTVVNKKTEFPKSTMKPWT